MFSSEKNMSKSFQAYIKRKIGSNYIPECEGLWGIPDYILFNKLSEQQHDIVAVELKLKNWKRALTQAFRYKNYSHLSIVVLDENFVKPALKHLQEFQHFGIGLASYSDKKEFTVHHLPLIRSPFCQRTTQKLMTQINGVRKRKTRQQHNVINFLENLN